METEKTEQVIEQKGNEKTQPVMNMQKIIPLAKWNNYYDYPLVSSLRQLRFKNPNNFNNEVLKCIGKKVYICPQKFFNWVDKYCTA